MYSKSPAKAGLFIFKHGSINVGTQISVGVVIVLPNGSAKSVRCILDNLVDSRDGTFSIAEGKSSIRKDLNQLSAEELETLTTTKNQKESYSAMKDNKVVKIIPVGDIADTFFQKSGRQGIPQAGINVSRTIDFYVNDKDVDGYSIFKKNYDL